MPYSVTSAPEPKTGPSTAALVLGVVGLVLGLVPILALFALVLGLLAVIFGIVGIRRNANRGFAITGLVTGAIEILLAIIGFVIVNNAFGDLNNAAAIAGLF